MGPAPACAPRNSPSGTAGRGAQRPGEPSPPSVAPPWWAPRSQNLELGRSGDLLSLLSQAAPRVWSI